MSNSLIAVDIGATNIRVASGSPEGIKHKLQEKTNLGGPEAIPSQIIDMISLLDEKPRSVGIGSIGPIDIRIGEIKNSPNFPFNCIPIVESIKRKLNVPISMVNDCTAGVLGEQKYGAGKGFNNLVYITLSTGVGGGAIVDGSLLQGTDGNAVEVGHLTIDSNSPLICGCGCKGHWEAFCGGKNIENLTRYVLGDEMHLLLEEFSHDNTGVSPEIIFNAANLGDERALRIVEEYGKINAIGFADVINMFNPEIITVGGSIALNHPKLVLNPIKQRLSLHLINRKPNIMITPLGDEVVLYGALALAEQALI